MNKNRIDVSNEISRIHNWILSWMDEDGGIHGPVIHKVGPVLRPYPHKVQFIRFDNIEDTTWTQAMALVGYVELYKKTRNKEFLTIAKRIANKLVEIQQSNGCFDHAAFEHDSDQFRKNNRPIIHQTHPDVALLRLCEITKDKKYVRAVERNLDFVIENYFDKSIGTFRSSPISKVHIANMTSVSVEALIRLYKINNDDKLLKIANSCGDWLCNLFNGVFMPYGDYKEHSNPLTFYNAITLQGLDDLYFETRDSKYFRLIKKIIEFLSQSYDTESGFYVHRNYKARYPQYVAASGMMLWNIVEAINTGVKCDVNPHVKALKSAVYPNGGIPSYIGYGEWQDNFPCSSWVAMAFAGLSAYTDKVKIRKVEFEPFTKKWGRYSFLDKKDRFTLIKDGKIMWQAKKKSEIPEINKIKAFYQKNILLRRTVDKAINLIKRK